MNIETKSKNLIKPQRTATIRVTVEHFTNTSLVSLKMLHEIKRLFKEKHSNN
jgi:hypothetical protein